MNKHQAWYTSATDLTKELGVTYKTAWRMDHEIRNRIAKQESQLIINGIPQMDEMFLSYMGSKKQGRSLLNKTLIVGIYEKTTNNLIVKVLKKADKKNLLKFALQHISVSCPLFTDSWKGYHQFGYVSSNGVNTNQIESVWKHLRKTFRNSCQGFKRKHSLICQRICI
ncbi:IS1595 family transposase [Spiroplasma endosymbiont of Nebria brevicollis]|uniref:IS1595 family transposase n=1 Tax=Spiroplasma endosymbiont of Nebria brevicollis TaxID=3066284 RepID=UPI00313C97CF